MPSLRCFTFSVGFALVVARSIASEGRKELPVSLPVRVSTSFSVEACNTCLKGVVWGMNAVFGVSRVVNVVVSNTNFILSYNLKMKMENVTIIRSTFEV